MKAIAFLLLAICPDRSPAQSQTSAEELRRIEVTLQRLESGTWKTLDPGLVLAQNDRVRFRFRANFEGYLYVLNHSTSGKYEQLFPRRETGENNRIMADRDYDVPATDAVFRIAGPAGREIVYWLVSPVSLNDAGSPAYTPLPPPPPQDKHFAPDLIPRCDDEIFRARGDCVDSSAGPQRISKEESIPPSLAGRKDLAPRDLIFLREQGTSIVASPRQLTGPIIYEFRLAHR
jgi:hypothetical protein